jgi:segregation and condensation protein B
LIRSATEVSLASSKSTSSALQAAYEKDLGKEIGEAGLEVLAIVLYQGPSTRAQIDYIRGVNTSSTIRTLLARGLLERTGNPEDGREYLYRPTVELLAHLGIPSTEELPNRAEIAAELKAFEASSTQEFHE